MSCSVARICNDQILGGSSSSHFVTHTHTQLGEVVGHCDNGSVVRGREGGRERDRQTGRLTDKGKNRDRQTEGQRDRDRETETDRQ